MENVTIVYNAMQTAMFWTNLLSGKNQKILLFGGDGTYCPAKETNCDFKNKNTSHSFKNFFHESQSATHEPLPKKAKIIPYMR